MTQPVTTDAPTTTGPTPNNMPGAPAATQTVENPPPAPAPKAPVTAPDATTTPTTEDAPPTQQPGESNVDWKDRAKLWEDRAKVKGVTQEALDKAKQWDDYQATLRTKEENDRIALQERDTEIATLKETAAREKVARTTGVPPELIVGKTLEEMEASAKVAADWRGAAVPATSAAPSGVVTATDKVEGPTQITSRDELARMTPADRMQAYRDGRLKNLGAVPGPGDLRNMQHAKK